MDVQDLMALQAVAKTLFTDPLSPLQEVVQPPCVYVLVQSPVVCEFASFFFVDVICLN